MTLCVSGVLEGGGAVLGEVCGEEEAVDMEEGEVVVIAVSKGVFKTSDGMVGEAGDAKERIHVSKVLRN